jgi:hypothetical protein
MAKQDKHTLKDKFHKAFDELKADHQRELD